MTQALPKLLTFNEFIEWYPNDGKRYELHKGVIIEMPPPTGQHEKIIAFLSRKLTVEFDRLNLPYGIPKTVLVKTPSAESAYSPDVLLLNLDNLDNEPLFQKQSTVSQAASVPIVIEVVSSNWRDDYYNKFGDYEEMGIPEYWIADYAALGGRKFIGNPKQPTIFVCELVDGEYQMTAFQGNTAISSPTFPQLNLTAQQIFNAAN
ncbi:MAG: Uma2 family endonuclease [Nostoc sp. DedQUE12b]|uniref:Uma2 family endonuclease n=1 Tax=Nostoc sp. DedQUE12b TaxID=3075398 RepID=UPI002AD2BE97|nr:Uma2 family endonuclease [Nostoc sp. DedQUE12b]MDZ8089760.1 Uma2 family endonuclease [Nostoc sp. DedQUE12b]